MEYLVLQQFVSFGKLLRKGTVVDESMIRSPRLRISERKIVPAVSSFNVPVELGSEGPAPQDGLGIDIDTKDENPKDEVPVDENPTPPVVPEEVPKLTFKKK